VRILLWLILLAICWPLALAALIILPIGWLILLPFRIIGVTMEGVIQLIRAIFLLPARVPVPAFRFMPATGQSTVNADGVVANANCDAINFGHDLSDVVSAAEWRRYL